MAGDKRKVQEINAGSMADIAFLLLIFFLVATTMNVDTGLARMLPPMPPEDQKQEDIKVKERNMFLVLVNGAGQIMAGVPGQQGPVDFRQLKDMVQEFVLNPMDDETYPEKKDKEIELADGSKWVYPVSEGVVSLQTTRDTGYQVYIMVQNELTRAFNEIRDDVAMKKFNKKFADLNDDESKAVTTAVPLKISEAEPRQVGGKK
ncbi:biopolymer transporter ExbD [uncultured Alistipes sp.]|uniref:ExbD/TolR family protein n=1 Tax=uncultured Alistipes sp. TaxID=538949 RepID=UPI0025F6829A|nr:biopolymer transporter ExbD [uncultured Alistipes sp.]